ncbi:hypothetical protein BDF20DRAFT_840503 [Mycotypha africana]|uniref:uncharacterized protein n=1 Tax=Mycotypha africana TaxID=64632 RepID=UPI0023018B37|nr:uncharacterized protein BDF20DRAFT_840503 [Mycotypha africana]KAI8967109.1 hypothetical protein BDF20DRAFT_840503 [Mycotypha africana]
MADDQEYGWEGMRVIILVCLDRNERNKPLAKIDNDMHPFMMVCGKMRTEPFIDKRAIHSHQKTFSANGAGNIRVPMTLRMANIDNAISQGGCPMGTMNHLKSLGSGGGDGGDGGGGGGGATPPLTTALVLLRSIIQRFVCGRMESLLCLLPILTVQQGLGRRQGSAARHFPSAT